MRATSPLPPLFEGSSTSSKHDTHPHKRVPHTHAAATLHSRTPFSAVSGASLSTSAVVDTRQLAHAVGRIQHRELRAGSLHEQQVCVQAKCPLCFRVCVSEFCALMTAPRACSQCLTGRLLHHMSATDTHHTFCIIPTKREGTHPVPSFVPCPHQKGKEHTQCHALYHAHQKGRKGTHTLPHNTPVQCDMARRIPHAVVPMCTRVLLTTTGQQPDTHTHTQKPTPHPAAGVSTCWLSLAAPGGV